MFLYMLHAEELTTFVLDDFLKGVCIALEDRDRPPPKQRACMLTTLYRLSQSLEILSHNANHWPSLHRPVESGAWGNGARKC